MAEGDPEQNPNIASAHQIAYAFNFTPEPVQFFDQYIYADDSQGFIFASGDNRVKVQFKVEDFPS